MDAIKKSTIWGFGPKFVERKKNLYRNGKVESSVICQ